VDAVAHAAASEPCREDGLLGFLCHLSDGLRSRRRIGHRLRREDHEHGIDIGVGDHIAGRGRKALGARVSEDVDRVAVRPHGRQVLVELLHGLGRELGELAATCDQRVGGHDARAACVGDDSEAGAFGHLVACDELGAVEDLADLEDACDAGALEGCLVDGVFGGHGTGMGRCGAGGFGEASGLVGHDRLGAREGARCGHEPAGIRDRLDVQDDRLGLLVLAEVVDEIAEVDVEHVADGDEVRESDVLFEGPIEDGSAQSAGLGDERDVPGLGHGIGEGGVDVQMGNEESEAIGADDAHAVEALAFGCDAGFEGAPLLASLFEAGGDDDDAEDAGLAAFADEVRDLLGPSADDGEVWGAREALDVGITLYA